MLERQAQQKRNGSLDWTFLLQVGSAERIPAQVPYTAVGWLWCRITYYYYYYYLLQLTCHSVAVVLTIVQKEQIRINIHKRNNIKNTVQTIQNTINTNKHITKILTHYKAHKYTHPHITKQVKTTSVKVKINPVQDTPTWKSHNTIKYPQYKVTLMYMVILSPRTSP
jgi:hypothetical protein